MAFNQTEFHIAKVSDRQITESLKNLLREEGYGWTRADFTPIFGGSPIVVKPENIDKDENLCTLLNQNQILFQSLRFYISDNQSVWVNRDTADRWHDKAYISPGQEGDIQRYGRFVATAKKLLGEVVPNKTLSTFLGEDAERHYAARDTYLSKQEQLLSQLFDRMEQQATEWTARLDRKQAELEELHSQRRTALENEFNARDQALQEKENQLARVRAEIDDRENRHVRRKIREDLKAELQKRGTKFELTTGTRGLRKTVFIFTIVLLILFGSAAAALVVRDLNSGSTADPWLIGRQFAFTLAFGITAVFFIRWNHQWFQRHADEEFKLKRLDLDIDRASWLVEMVMEWKDEKGTEIPEDLLDRLSRNLFVEEGPCEENLHPADVLASTIFGAAANAKLKLPNGTEITLDRKSIRRLGKTSIEQTE